MSDARYEFTLICIFYVIVILAFIGAFLWLAGCR
jgi:hypothetical protein